MFDLAKIGDGRSLPDRFEVIVSHKNLMLLSPQERQWAQFNWTDVERKLRMLGYKIAVRVDDETQNNVATCVRKQFDNLAVAT